MSKTHPAIQIFICHADEDTQYAKKLAESLPKERYIPSTSATFGNGDNTSRRKTFTQIRHTRFFIPLLSAHFHTSDSAEQEVGAAIASEKTIMTFQISETDAHGYLRTFIINDGTTIPKIVEKLNQTTDDLHVLEGNRYALIEDVIERLKRSESFYNSAMIASELNMLGITHKNHVNALARVLEKNERVHNSFPAYSIIMEILVNNDKKLDEEVMGLPLVWRGINDSRPLKRFDRQLKDK